MKRRKKREFNLKELKQLSKYKSKFQCFCGKYFVTNFYSVKYGSTRSCGCIRGRKLSYTPTWTCWKNMKARCYNTNLPTYKHYGLRGITVCKRWLESYENFLDDMGPKPIGLTLERVNNSGNYTSRNCKWATMKQQLNNTRRNRVVIYKDELTTVSALAELVKIHKDTLFGRLRRGWTIATLSQPIDRRYSHGKKKS